MQPWQPGQQPPESQPYGPPQGQSQPYGQYASQQQPLPQSPYLPPPRQPQPAYEPASHTAPRRSQGLAITALVVGVAAAAVAFTTLGSVAMVIALVAGVLSVIALIAKTQGGKLFAAGGLAAAMVSFPIALVMYTVRADTARSNDQTVDCMTRELEKGADADLDKAWNC